jgi:hypothetical protein
MGGEDMRIACIGAVAVSLVISPAFAQSSWPNKREGDFVLQDYRFGNGEIHPDARLVIVPASTETHGHFTHLRTAFWKSHLAAFMKTLPPEM